MKATFSPYRRGVRRRHSPGRRSPYTFPLHRLPHGFWLRWPCVPRSGSGGRWPCGVAAIGFCVGNVMAAWLALGGAARVSSAPQVPTNLANHLMDAGNSIPKSHLRWTGRRCARILCDCRGDCATKIGLEEVEEGSSEIPVQGGLRAELLLGARRARSTCGARREPRSRRWSVRSLRGIRRSGGFDLSRLISSGRILI